MICIRIARRYLIQCHTVGQQFRVPEIIMTLMSSRTSDNILSLLNLPKFRRYLDSTWRVQCAHHNAIMGYIEIWCGVHRICSVSRCPGAPGLATLHECHPSPPTALRAPLMIRSPIAVVHRPFLLPRYMQFPIIVSDINDSLLSKGPCSVSSPTLSLQPSVVTFRLSQHLVSTRFVSLVF